MSNFAKKEEKTKDNTSTLVAKENSSTYVDSALHTSASIQLQHFQDIADQSPQVQDGMQFQLKADNFVESDKHPLQRMPASMSGKGKNNTGLSDQLKSGVESLSGQSMDDVKVHFNSAKPKQLEAHAYAQGSEIHVASGQEKHLPHEAWHVAQQKQGRVKPTKEINGNVSINDDAGLEKEADVMGAKAANSSNSGVISRKALNKSTETIQRNKDEAPENNAAFKTLNDGTLKGLGAALIQCPQEIGSLGDPYLVDLIKTAFESNWFKAKKCLTTDFWPGFAEGAKPPHAASIQLMQALVDMRGRIWDRFVTRVQPNISVAIQEAQSLPGFENLQNPNKLNDNFGLKDAVGSESVTSDIDLSAMGENTEIGVSMINTLFNAEYGTEPGTFFDINVYSSDWMFGSTEISEAGSRDIVKSANSEAISSTEKDLSPENQKKKDDRNEVWSMVKIRRNMTLKDWEFYKNAQLNLLDDNQQEKASMDKKFADVDSEYTTFHRTVERETVKLKEALDHEEAQQRSVFADSDGVDHFAHEALEMQASNIEYEKIILEVKRLRLEIQRLHKANKEGNRVVIEELLLQVHDGVSRGLTYANEVYATEGAVLNTVLGDQGAKKKMDEMNSTAKGKVVDSYTYALSKEQYLQSVNENVGDTLHSLNHNAEDPPYAVYRAGKYIARLCNAATKLLTPEVAEDITGYHNLEEIGRNSVIEKKGAAGSDPLAVHEFNSFFSAYQAKHLPDVKNQAIVFGAMVAAEYKNTKE